MSPKEISVLIDGNDLLIKHGLHAWVLGLHKSRTKLGLTNFSERVITLSRLYIAHNTFAHIRGTILHEIAHALAGREHGHDNHWKCIARAIGAEPKSVCKDAFLPGNWMAFCPQCGRSYSRCRRPKRDLLYHCHCGSPASLEWEKAALPLN